MVSDHGLGRVGVDPEIVKFGARLMILTVFFEHFCPPKLLMKRTAMSQGRAA